MPSPIIEVKNIHKTFLSKVLKGVDFTAYEGQVTTILGSSGSGKSTLLRCLNLLEVPDEGEISIDNEQVEFTQKKDNRIISNPGQIIKIRTKMPMIFQHFNLWSHLSVIENVSYAPLKVLKKNKSEVYDIATHCLEKVGLQEFANYFPNQLSGGQKQRVSIARAMAMQPKIILLDEPTSALDPEMVNEVLLAMQKLTTENCSMVLVTHEINFAKNISDKVIFLHQGVIEEQGSAEILTNPNTTSLVNFLQYS